MEREKVLLVRSPNLHKSEGWKKQRVLRTPTNLALLASYVRERGYEPKILDFETYNLNRILEISKVILDQNIRYISFSTLTPRFPTILKITEELKRSDKDIVTIVGGPHITGRPQDCKYDSIDYGVVGEGEETFLDLLNCLASNGDVANIPNLVHKQNGLTINPRRPFIKDLNSLPFPAWDLLNLKEYLDPPFFGEESHVGVFTSRGCAYDCIFCASKVTWERKIRHRSIENIVKELTELKELGINNLYFYDDNVAINKERAISLFSIIKDLNFKYQIQIRADSVTAELASALKISGCVSAAIGVETGNAEMLKYIHKKETKDEIRNAVKILKDFRVPITTSYIIGLPGDTHETVQETLDFAKELNTEQMKFMLLTPCPGTEVYDMAVKQGKLNPNDLEQMERTTFYDSTDVNLSKLTVEELLHYQDIAYKQLEK